MLTPREIKRKGYMPPRVLIQILIKSFWTYFKLFGLHPIRLKKLSEISKSKENIRYVRPKRSYEIPKYQPNMNCCQSNKKYLRPTLWCDHTIPEIIALAHELGAYQLSDEEFVENAFRFVKNNVHVEIRRLNELKETVYRGTGSCYHITSFFIALCRCAGIKARYKIFQLMVGQTFQDVIVDADPLIQAANASLGSIVFDGESEVFLNGEWVSVNVNPTDERQAAGGIAITKVGDSALGNWFYAVPGTIMLLESIPLGMGFFTSLGDLFASGSQERVNARIQNQIEQGKKILQEAGGVEAYNKKILQQKGPPVIYRKDEDIFDS